MFFRVVLIPQRLYLDSPYIWVRERGGERWYTILVGGRTLGVPRGIEGGSCETGGLGNEVGGLGITGCHVFGDRFYNLVQCSAGHAVALFFFLIFFFSHAMICFAISSGT